MANELQTTGMKTVAQFLNNIDTQKYLEGMLKERTGQFVTSLVSLANTAKGFAGANVEPKSLLFCGLKAAAMNLPLEPNLGFAWAIPYKNNKVKPPIVEAQFQMGAKGYVQLAQRTGQYKKLNAIAIHEGELKMWDPFTEELILELESDFVKREKLPVIGYAAYFELTNGFKKTDYWPIRKTEHHGRQYSKAYGYMWTTDFDKMSLKTVLKNLLSKWGPLSTEMQDAIRFDQSIIRGELGGSQEPEYIDGTAFIPEIVEDTLAAEFAKEKSKGVVVDAELIIEGKLFNPEGSRELDAKIAAMEVADAKTK